MKSINKKVAGIALASVAALILGACGSSGSGENADGGDSDSSSSQDQSSGDSDESNDSGSAGDSNADDSSTDDSDSADGDAGDSGTEGSSDENESSELVSSEPVTITFRNGFPTSSPGLEGLKKVTKKYEDARPNITVEIVADSANYEADMKVRMASGNLPDLFTTHGWSLLRYSPFLMPLNDQPWAEHFNDALAPAMKDDAGNFYALPITTDVAGIVYSKTALEKVGVDAKDLKTWDDFNAALAKLKDAGIIPISASSKDAWLSGDLIDFIASGAFDDESLEGFTSGTFDSEGYGKLMGLLEGWAKDGYFNPDFVSATTDAIAKNLAQAKTAFIFVQNGITANAWEYVPDAKLGFMPVPTFDGDAFLIGGEAYAIGVAKSSEKKKAALDYLNFLAQPENLLAQTSITDSLPGLTNAEADLGKLQGSYDAFVNEDYRLLPYFDRVYLPGGAWDAMISTVSGVVTGQMTAEDATKQMKETYQSLRQQQEK